jgi:hypothetical protein
MVKVNDIYSNSKSISLDVPQNSVLGPLLLFIYINDLPYSLVHLTVKLFDDDTTIR